MSTAIVAAAKYLGGQSELARIIGVTPGYISQVVSGFRKPPADRCPDIERATDGNVVVEDLRPDVRWARISDPEWPHPNGRPCIDVAATLVPIAAAPTAQAEA